MNGIQVQLIGNVTRDPELRYSGRGNAWCVLGIAVNYSQGFGEKRVEKTAFIDVKCFNKMAENVIDSLRKGSRVVVTGRLESDQWEAQDGSKRTSWNVVADTIAPDLRFATTTITRNERQGGGYGGAPSGGNGSSAPARTPAAPEDEGHNPFGVPDDEQPF